MTTLLHSSLSRLAYFPRTLRLIWEAAGGWTVAWALVLVVQGVLPAVAVYTSRVLVDRLVVAAGDAGNWGWETVWPLLVPAALIGAIIVLTEVLHSASDWIRSVQSELVQDHISALMHQKSSTVDLAFYESYEYYDDLHRARDNASGRSLALLEDTGSMLQDSVTFVAMGLLLLPYGAWLPFALLISTLPALFVVLRYQWRYHQWWQRTTSDRRRSEYYDYVLTDSEIAAELRLFGLGEYFQQAFQQLRRSLRNDRLKLMRRQSVAQLLAGAGALLITGAVMVWMVWRALQGLVTLGDLVLFYQAFSQSQGLMRSLLANAGQIYSNSLYISHLFAFLELEPNVKDPADPAAVPHSLKQGVSFHNVTFRYPDSERIALRNFNLEIRAGQVVAVVGENGAGKSTLIKLLCRFYDPEAGRIELDGIDIRTLSLADLRRQITALFQFPNFYHTSASQNIAIGDLQDAPEALEIEAAARSAGAHEFIQRLPRGYATLLGRWFAEGTDLSGGEWQRIALARAFYRRARIVVLDEPTSFMDSWAEAQWLDRFRELVDGQTAIIITHRFTTALRADVIYVMHDGQIVESGSHEALLALGGRYAQSWAAQTKRDSATVAD